MYLTPKTSVLMEQLLFMTIANDTLRWRVKISHLRKFTYSKMIKVILCQINLLFCHQLTHNEYRRVAFSNTPRLEPHPGVYRLLMKGIFDAYVLGPFDKKFIFELVTQVRSRDYMVLLWNSKLADVIIWWILG